MPGFDGCACTGRTLVKLVRPTLLAVLADGPAHGYAIRERLAAFGSESRAPADHAAIYRALQTMEREGLVVSGRVSGGTGPERRVYRLTADGRRCAKQWARTLAAFRESVDALLRRLAGGTGPRGGRKADPDA
jgi:DNA-binding PadR family transcriptional regulator